MLNFIRLKKLFASCLLVFSILFSGTSYAFEFDKINVLSKLGEPLKIDVYFKKDNNDFKITEAKQDTYELFGTSRSNENKSILIFKDMEINGLFHIKGSKAFNDPVIDIILNFEDENNKTNYYKRINKEIKINGINSYFENAPKKIAIQKYNTPSSKVAHIKEKPFKSINYNGVYKTKTGDSLYKISKKVSLDTNKNIIKIAAWIFQKNRRAFMKKNPNSLKAYFDIQIPTSSDIKKSNITFDIAKEVLKQKNVIKKRETKTTALPIDIKNTKKLFKRKISAISDIKPLQLSTFPKTKLVTPKTANESYAIVENINNKNSEKINKYNSRIDRLEKLLEKIKKSNEEYIKIIKNNQELKIKVDNVELVNNILAAIGAILALLVIIGLVFIIVSLRRKRGK